MRSVYDAGLASSASGVRALLKWRLSETSELQKAFGAGLVFRLAFVTSILTGSINLALAIPHTAAAKCPDEPGVICPDLRFDFPDGLQSGPNIAVTARWFNERTEKTVADEAWLAERVSPVYLWAWNHQPIPDEWQTTASS